MDKLKKPRLSARPTAILLPAGNRLVRPPAQKSRVTSSGNPAISAYLRPVAFRRHLAVGLAFFCYSLRFRLVFSLYPEIPP